MIIRYEEIPDADYYDLKEAVLFLKQVDSKNVEDHPAYLLTDEVRKGAIESIVTIVANYFPEKVRLIVAIIIDVLQKILESKYNNQGEEKKLNWFKRNKLGAVSLIAIIKIIAIIFRKK